jgi:hypothetical protein
MYVEGLLKSKEELDKGKPQNGGQQPLPQFSLPWSASDKSRDAWTKKLIGLVAPAIKDYELAKDINTLYPNFSGLSESNKIKVICLFWCWVAYYECGWDPDSRSVDVGTKDDQDTWSIGLLQMSVVDQESYHIPMGLDFRKLLIPENNLELGHRIMLKQIKNYGKIFIPKGDRGLYWAVIHPGGKYDKTKEILNNIRKGI